MGCPTYFVSAGFGSNASMVESPPFMKRKITRLTRAADNRQSTTPRPVSPESSVPALGHGFAEHAGEGHHAETVADPAQRTLFKASRLAAIA